MTASLAFRPVIEYNKAYVPCQEREFLSNNANGAGADNTHAALSHHEWRQPS